MTLSRRQFLMMSGGSIAALSLPSLVFGQETVVVEMLGSPRGERVWFTPLGLAMSPGTRVRFVNRDPVNSHTATAYHPRYFERARRIPGVAEPFHSGYLLPDEAFEVVLSEPGVYDYYCLPHEREGMVGRIVVGTPDTTGWQGPAPETTEIASAALATLPSVEQILAHGQVNHEKTV